MAASISEKKNMEALNAQWDSDGMAEKYARAEAVTKPYADIMMQKAGVSAFTGDEQILDVATGTGAVLAALYEAVFQEKRDALKVIAGDISDSMLAYVEKRKAREGWTGVETRKIDGVNVDTNETFSHIFINFGVFMFPSDSFQKCANLLHPNGFLAVSTHTVFPWFTYVERAHARMANAPRLPSLDECKDRMYQNRPFDRSYIQSELEKAGFEDVDIMEHKQPVASGTPAEFAETMHMPLMVVISGWPEEGRDKLHRELTDKMREVAEEEFGKDGIVSLTFQGLISVARKA